MRKNPYTLKVNDLVLSSTGHHDNGQSISQYCKILSLKTPCGEFHDTIEILTGYGDKNTIVEIEAKQLKVGLSDYCPQYMDDSDKEVKLDTHKIYQIFHYKESDKFYEDKLNKKVRDIELERDFILSNVNRHDKLEELLS